MRLLQEMAACCTVLLAGATTAAPQRIMLPDDVVPSHYDLSLTPDAKALTFTAKVGIDLEIKRPTASIILNAADLVFDTVALAGETGEHWFDAELHRIRGEILIKQTPADPAAAEAAFLAAIAVAQQQKARSFELRAALSLAKLYQSTGRPAEALDILGPALEGFSPTPEFAEIGEAMEYFAAIEASRECAPRATA